MQIIINFLTSQHVIKESAKVSSQDVTIGIPAMLLCIEMALFSILHLWAYPWRPYDIHRSPIVAAEGGAGLQYQGQAAYRGGTLGIYAFMDAFNPLDIMKAVARGFRWMFVGRKTREGDISYKPHLQDSTTDGTASGPTKSRKYQPLHNDDSEIHVPYSHAYNSNDSKSFSKPFAAPRSEADVGAVGAFDRSQEGWDRTRPMPVEDTGYHGAQGEAYLPPQNIGYQAPRGADPRREEWADPRSHGGQYGAGNDNMI